VLKDRLNRCIREIVTKDRCDFYDRTVVGKIINAFNEIESKDHEYWLKTLVKVIGRIKDDKHGNKKMLFQKNCVGVACIAAIER